MATPITVADTAIAIGGDLTGYDKSLKVAETHAQTLGQKLKGVFSPKAIMAGIGSAGGAALGVALSGANKLDAATRQLQADTGMTRAEAVKAEHALAGMFRNNLQGFDEIGAAMAAVHNDLGLTGKVADETTAKFLKFATATGQDAAGAVASFDDILDAWNLTAADSGPLMDGLIADHQKFGGVIADSQAALAAMAPAMQAANMSIDEGRALLNLFNASGIDAAKAPAALARAVAQLKPGQSLDDLIAQISSIEDPTLRGQKAMEIFGVRGGVQLAQAFKPGIQSLDDFAISAGDAAGKTTDAAKAIEDGFGNKFKMILKNASGWLSEFGTNFGDLVMIAAAFGPQLTTAITSALGGLAGLIGPKITAAVLATGPGAAIAGSGVGSAIGGAIAAAVPIGIAAAGGIGIALAFKSIFLDPGLQEQTRAIGKAVGEQIATGTLEQLQQSKGALEKGISDINALPLGGFLYGDQARDLQTQLDAVNERLLAAGAEMPQSLAEGIAAAGPKAFDAATQLAESVAAGIKQTTPAVEIAVEDLVKTLGTSMSGVLAAAKITGSDGMIAMAQGITAARQKPLDALGTLTEMLKTALTPMGEIAHLAAVRATARLAQGLRSGDPAVRAQAAAVVKATADRLGELAGQGGKSGRAAMAELDKGIRSKIPEVRSASLAAKNAAVAQLNATKGPAGTAGAAAGEAFAAALLAAIKGPLNYATLAGQTIARGLHQAGAPGFAMGTPYVPRDMLAQIHQGEIIVPRAQSDAIRSGQATLGAAGGGGTTVNNFNIPITGLVRARDPLEIATQLRRFADFGVLTPKAVLR
jgi:hypothetical protein